MIRLMTKTFMIFHLVFQLSSNLFSQTTTTADVKIDSSQYVDTTLYMKTYQFPQVDIIGRTPCRN